MIAPEAIGLARALASADAISGRPPRPASALSADLAAHGGERGWPILRPSTLAKAIEAYAERYAVASATRRTVAA